MSHHGKEEFEEFTNIHAKMKYQEHEILYNKWVAEER
jgi:cytochrome b involved in lipid metabolism